MTGPAMATVPKPPAVLRLPQLGNMPVPYITQYLTPEQAADDSVPGPEHVERQAGGPTVGCTCVFGEGRAEIGRQCPHRQRKAMAHRLCNVCGKRVDETDAMFVGAGAADLYNSGEVTSLARRVSREAPTHRRCLAYSALVCPRLRAGSQECPLAIVAGDYPLLDLWITPDTRDRIMPHGTPREVLGRPLGLLSYYLAHLDSPAVRWTTLATWMGHAAPKPYHSLWLQALEQDR
jgi:hypothetical protein